MKSAKSFLVPAIFGAAGLAVCAGATATAVAMVLSRKRYSFDGKTVLVTGGSRGLGLELSRQLAREGANVVICARDQDELARAAHDLRRPGGRVMALQCDVGDEREVKAMVAHVYEEWGEIDVLINNAGQIQVGPSEVMRLTDFERSMRVHFWGPLHTTLAVLPRMRARRDGRIVNISSIGGKISVPHLLPYSASKFALTGLSEGLHAELKREGIAVTTVCPGLMRTGSPRNAEFKSKHELEYAWFAWSDSMPGISVAAERAAHRILRACRNGEAEVILTLPARLAVMLHGLFPGLTADMLAVVNRLLPNAGGIGSASAKGHESESLLTRNPALALTRKQERRQNQIA